jgi:DNA-binding MarR family transcriptional regulator
MVIAKRRLPSVPARSLSTTRRELLIDGSDATFRSFVLGFFSVAGRLDLIRERVGALYGISGAQFSIMMGIRQLEERRGVSLGGLADVLHQRGTFVTSQTNRLRERGLIVKKPNPDDRRGVLMRLTPQGHALIEKMLPLVSSLNDQIFEQLDANDFTRLRRIVATLADSTEEALTVVERAGKRAHSIGA